MSPSFRFRSSRVFVSCVAFFLLAAEWTPQAWAGTWNPQNDPANFGRVKERVFSALPASGRVSKLPWTGYAWKSRLGGLGQRWRSQTPAWNYSLPAALSAVAKLPVAEIARLSPAEKFDFWTGAAGFPLATDERRRNDPNAVSWGGLCHGWASAASVFDEPAPVTLQAPGGTEVAFGSADVKALLSFATGELLESPRRFVGERCMGGASADSSACQDAHAGAFHLLLANRVGLMKESFVVELSEGAEIWNKPVVSYSSSVRGTQKPQAAAAAGTVTEKIVHTEVTFVHGDDARWDAQGAVIPTRVTSYDYILEIDGTGAVVGGRWISDHPDFLWRLDGNEESIFAPLAGGRFARLEELYLKSVKRWPRVKTDVSGGAVSCPKGFSAESQDTDIGDGTRFSICVKGTQAFAVRTPLMLDACRIGGRSDCEMNVWEKNIYLSIRGFGQCPRGSDRDLLLGACVNEDTAFGPFVSATAEKCAATLGSLCDKLAVPISDLGRALR